MDIYIFFWVLNLSFYTPWNSQQKHVPSHNSKRCLCKLQFVFVHIYCIHQIYMWLWVGGVQLLLQFVTCCCCFAYHWLTRAARHSTVWYPLYLRYKWFKWYHYKLEIKIYFPELGQEWEVIFNVLHIQKYLPFFNILFFLSPLPCNVCRALFHMA